jgi:hypothetical protein
MGLAQVMRPLGVEPTIRLTAFREQSSLVSPVWRGVPLAPPAGAAPKARWGP